LLDKKGFQKVDTYAQKTEQALEQGNFDQATAWVSKIEQAIWNNAGRVDFYNILVPIRWDSADAGKNLVSIYVRILLN